MKMFDLQMFAEAVSGKKLVYLYRIKSKAASADGEYTLIIHFQVSHYQKL